MNTVINCSIPQIPQNAFLAELEGIMQFLFYIIIPLLPILVILFFVLLLMRRKSATKAIFYWGGIIFYIVITILVFFSYILYEPMAVLLLYTGFPLIGFIPLSLLLWYLGRSKYRFDTSNVRIPKIILGSLSGTVIVLVVVLYGGELLFGNRSVENYTMIRRVESVAECTDLGGTAYESPSRSAPIPREETNNDTPQPPANENTPALNSSNETPVQELDLEKYPASIMDDTKPPSVN